MRLADIERRRANLAELSRIVGAMRSIASMRVQEAAGALASVREYGAQLAEAVRDALAISADRARSSAGDAAAMPPGSHAPPAARRPQSGRRALVLCMSEHGFVGGFNERLMEEAASGLDRSDTLLILGFRGAGLAQERGFSPAWSGSMAIRLASIPDTVRRVQERLYPLIVSGGVTRAEVIYGRYRRGAAPQIERLRLFPLALPSAPARVRRAMAPLHGLPAARLLERLTAEYLLAQLTEAATESLAAENGARFAAMEAAHDNVARKLESLHLEASRARQEEVTTELLDLVIGEQALER